MIPSRPSLINTVYIFPLDKLAPLDFERLSHGFQEGNAPSHRWWVARILPIICCPPTVSLAQLSRILQAYHY